MKKIVTFCIAAIVFAGCNSSKITTTWKAKYMPQAEYRKILVLGLINDNDRSIREKMENHFVGDLKELGYTAISSLQEYGPHSFDKMDEATVLSKMKNSGVDGIITIVLLNKDKQSKFVSSSIPYTGPSGTFWEYHSNWNRKIYEPGYYVTDTRYLWESNFYDVATQNLIYSAQTKTFDPSNTESMGHEYGLKIVKNMVRQQVLQDQSGKFSRYDKREGNSAYQY